MSRKENAMHNSTRLDRFDKPPLRISYTRYFRLVIVVLLIVIALPFVIKLILLSPLAVKPTTTIPSVSQIINWSSDGNLLVTIGTNQDVEIWDVSSGDAKIRATVPSVPSFVNDVTDAAFSPDNASIAVGYRNGVLLLWDIRANTSKFNIQASPSTIYEVAFSSDGTKIVTSDRDETTIRDAKQGAPILTIPEATFGLVWTPDSQSFVANRQGGVRVWNAETGQVVHDIGLSFGGPFAVSPNGKLLLVGNATWNISQDENDFEGTGSCNKEKCFGGEIMSVAWSPDNQHVAAGSGKSMCFEGSDYCVRDFNIRVWTVGANSPISVLSGHEEDVIALGWQPDGVKLTSVSLDDTIRVWDTTTDQSLETLNTGVVGQVVLSQDAKAVAVLGNDSTVRIWKLTD